MQQEVDQTSLYKFLQDPAPSTMWDCFLICNVRSLKSYKEDSYLNFRYFLQYKNHIFCCPYSGKSIVVGLFFFKCTKKVKYLFFLLKIAAVNPPLCLWWFWWGGVAVGGGKCSSFSLNVDRFNGICMIHLHSIRFNGTQYDSMACNTIQLHSTTGSAKPTRLLNPLCSTIIEVGGYSTVTHREFISSSCL